MSSSESHRPSHMRNLQPLAVTVSATLSSWNSLLHMPLYLPSTRSLMSAMLRSVAMRCFSNSLYRESSFANRLPCFDLTSPKGIGSSQKRSESLG